MKKLYAIFRIGGYAGCLAGVILLLAGKRISPPNPTLSGAGGLLIIAGFLCFFGSYAIFLTLRLNARSRVNPIKSGDKKIPENSGVNGH